jgi:hypothetical protein
MNDLTFPKEPPLPSIPSYNRASILVDNRSSIFSPDPLSNQKDEESSISGKLSNIEAQRIISVIQEIQKKVSQIDQLPDVMDNRVSSVFGGETFTLIRVILLIKILGSPSIRNKI